MPLSEDLIWRYSNEVDVDWWEAIILSHSQSATYYLCNVHDNTVRYGQIDNALQAFQPVPFEVILPSRNGEGSQDMALAICNVGLEMLQAVEDALEDPTEAIRCRYTIFIEGLTEPQYEPPLELALSDVALSIETMTATATRANIHNRTFPRQVYTTQLFPGLLRR